jgi:glycosyltransferase involved in cell wall biosynthesis
MKLGIILSAYDCEDTIEKCMSPWMGRLNCEIVAVSEVFEGFEPSPNNDSTVKILKDYLCDTHIVHGSKRPQKEHEARTAGLDRLGDCDFVLILDSDEFYSLEEVDRLLKWLENDFAENCCAWTQINFKNLTFNENTWVDGFRPPRIFKTEFEGYKLDRFFWDNDVIYKKGGREVPHKDFPNITAPKQICHPLHHTWVSGERSRKKVEYQLNHFGHCSYKWEDGELKFDDSYFVKTGERKPELLPL